MTKSITELAVASSLLGAELLEVSQRSTTVFRTATTISADTTDDSLNDSGSGFITAGFAVGNRVHISGFTSGGNNLQVATITALTAGKMTLGTNLVTEAAGPSVTVRQWSSRNVDLATVRSYVTDRPYRVGMFFTTAPTASEVLLLHTVTDAMSIPDNFSGSVGDVGTNPAATFTMDVLKNNVSFGTIQISTGGTFTFNTTGASESFAVGDQLMVRGPGTVGTAANVSITLRGTLA